jgi:uncharacterized protein YyaL (SSP411 family)
MSQDPTIVQPMKSNLLIHESSPYLVQHAYNPVAWYPWGEEALKRAKEEDKPILISIGYSACHWCHVMERESFENAAVAEVMNANFINIKVDREERPDIDQIYMEAVQSMNLRGGWPLNVFLTPETKPFYGGTYFPSSHWVNLLKQISSAFQNNRKELEQSAEEFTRSLNHSEIQKYGLSEPEYNFSIDDIDIGYRKLGRNFDHKYGGFDKAPKFPMPSTGLFLLRYLHLAKNESALKHLKLTLDRMAMGGLYDQVGGGFARYSTDVEWFAPHFEKMLYDNGQLISLYAEAYAVTREPLYKQVVYSTCEWVEQEMTNKEGGFFSAMDADTEGEEGKFYVWTKDEIKTLFPEEHALVSDYYSIGTGGNWEDGKNILFRNLSDLAFSNKHKIPLDQLLKKIASWNSLLFQKRNNRTKPALDDKILTSWNGIMLKGLVDAYRVFDEQKFLDLALRSAAFLRLKIQGSDKLYHNYKNGHGVVEGYLEDYAFVIQAYIALYQATFQEQWLVDAQVLTSYVLEHFYDNEDGMFYYTSALSEPLIARKKDLFDNVIPSSNAVMATNLHWLSHLLDSDKFKDISYRMVARIKKLLPTDLAYLCHWACLYTYHITPTTEIAIAGDYFIKFRKEFDKYYMPNTVFAGTPGYSELSVLKGRYPKDGWETSIFVCKNKTCGNPAHNIKDALQQMEDLR